MRPEKVDALLRQMESQSMGMAPIPIRQEKVNALVNQLERKSTPLMKPEGMTPEEWNYYSQTLMNPPAQRRNIQPFAQQSIAMNLRKQYPELQNLSDEQLQDLNDAIRSHRTGLVTQSLGKGALEVADIPQSLASLATGFTYTPDEYPSQKAARYLKEKGIADLNREVPLNSAEKIIGTGAEWGASALAASPAGAVLGASLKPAIAATKSMPALSKTLSGVKKGTELLTGATTNPIELAKLGATGVGLGATSGALQSLAGVSPETANLVGFAPFAGGLAKAVLSTPKAYKTYNPAAVGEREALEAHQQLRGAREAVKEQLSVPKELDIEKIGATSREAIKEKLNVLKSEKKEVTKPLYEEVKKVTERPTLKNTFDYFSEARQNIDPKDPLTKVIDKTSNLLINKGDVPLTAPQASKRIKIINNSKNKAWKSGDYDSYHFYKKTLSNLENDLELVPQVKKARQQESILFKDINAIENDTKIKKILSQHKYKGGNKILDSKVPSILIDLSEEELGPQKHLKKVIGNNPESIDQIKAYNFRNLYDSIVDAEGNVSNKKLDSYVNKNPGLFVWDPSLRTKLASISSANKYLKNVEQGIKEKMNSKITLQDAIKHLFSHTGGGALGFALSHSLSGALTGTGAVGAITGYKHLKNKAFTKKFKSLEEKAP